MEFDEALARLQTLRPKFQKTALERVIAERQTATPLLIESLRDAKRRCREIYDGDPQDNVLYLYALYLLAQFRETDAFAAIVDLFATPGDTVTDMSGDLVTEDLHRILASTFDGDLDLINKRLIENPAVNRYVRSAAIQTYLLLWTEQIISRRRVVDYYRFLFDEVLAGESDSDEDTRQFLYTMLVGDSLDLGAFELKDRIVDAFETDRIDPMFTDRKQIDRALAVDERQARENLLVYDKHSLISDAIGELRSWAVYREPAPAPAFPRETDGNLIPAHQYDPGPKTGRNDPCPCGSGKKYKKCCLHADR